MLSPSPVDFYLAIIFDYYHFALYSINMNNQNIPQKSSVLCLIFKWIKILVIFPICVFVLGTGLLAIIMIPKVHEGVLKILYHKGKEEMVKNIREKYHATEILDITAVHIGWAEGSPEWSTSFISDNTCPYRIWYSMDGKTVTEGPMWLSR